MIALCVEHAPVFFLAPVLGIHSRERERQQERARDAADLNHQKIYLTLGTKSTPPHPSLPPHLSSQSRTGRLTFWQLQFLRRLSCSHCSPTVRALQLSRPIFKLSSTLRRSSRPFDFMLSTESISRTHRSVSARSRPAYLRARLGRWMSDAELEANRTQSCTRSLDRDPGGVLVRSPNQGLLRHPHDHRSSSSSSSSSTAPTLTINSSLFPSP